MTDQSLTSTQLIVESSRKLQAAAVRQELATMADKLAPQIEAQIAADDYAAAFATCSEGIAHWASLGRRLRAIDWSYTTSPRQ